MVRGFESKENTRDSTLLDVISVLEGGRFGGEFDAELILNPVDDVRQFVEQFHGEDCVMVHARQMREREEAQRAEERKAFLKQINVFHAEDEEAGSGGSLELLDPEVMGEAPLLAKNNMEKAFRMQRSALTAKKGDGDDDDDDDDEDKVTDADLRFLPVKVYGKTPEGFTTLWQREYLRKKRAMKEKQKRLLQMQMAMLQTQQGTQAEEQMNEIALMRGDESILM